MPNGQAVKTEENEFVVKLKKELSDTNKKII